MIAPREGQITYREDRVIFSIPKTARRQSVDRNGQPVEYVELSVEDAFYLTDCLSYVAQIAARWRRHNPKAATEPKELLKV